MVDTLMGATINKREITLTEEQRYKQERKYVFHTQRLFVEHVTSNSSIFIFLTIFAVEIFFRSLFLTFSLDFITSWILTSLELSIIYPLLFLQNSVNFHKMLFTARQNIVKEVMHQLLPSHQMKQTMAQKYPHCYAIYLTMYLTNLMHIKRNLLKHV